MNEDPYEGKEERMNDCETNDGLLRREPGNDARCQNEKEGKGNQKSGDPHILRRYFLSRLIMSSNPISAIAVYEGKRVKGQVVFTEDLVDGGVFIDIDLRGLKKNALHGFHVHQAGDLSEQCTSMCAHFLSVNFE
jgi:hypothetical protein